MGRTPDAIQKGITSEYYAKAYFCDKGYIVLTPDTHETHYDFVLEKDGQFKRVQCKSTVLVKYDYAKQDGSIGPNLIRIRNKRGSKGTVYNEGDYDILVGVWKDGRKMYIFDAKDVLGEKRGETITVARENGEPLASNWKAPKPIEIVSF